MADSRVVDRIGRTLREMSRDVVEEQLPEHWRILIERLASLERRKDRSTRRADRGQRSPR